LPRVGRSALVSRWAEARSDTAVRTFTVGDKQIAPILIYDHFASVDVAEFVARFRAAEPTTTALPIRFVIVPTDLDASERLRSELCGSILPLHIDPLQLDDALAEHSILPLAGGPHAELTATASPTNAPAYDLDRHWLRGGLPESLAADSDRDSFAWRRALLIALLERDYSRWELPRASPLPEILRWVANQNSGELDDTACPVATRKELRSALHVFDRLGITRGLANFPAGSTSSLSKKRKYYVRDSGLLHATLGIETITQLREHGSFGNSWEGYAVEALIRAAGNRCTSQFYRENINNLTDEIDLVLDFRPHSTRIFAIECKANPNRRVKAGFYRACGVIGATERFLVHSGPTTVLGDDIDSLDLGSALRRVAEFAASTFRRDMPNGPAAAAAVTDAVRQSGC